MAKSKSPEEQLYDACASGSLKNVEKLLAAGGNVNGRSDVGGAKNLTPMHAAAASGDFSVVTFLRERGADVNARDAKGRTPLWSVLQRIYTFEDLERRLITLKKMIGAGASPIITDADGETLLHFAASLHLPGEDDEDEPDTHAEHLEGFDTKNGDAAVGWWIDYFVSLGVSLEAKDGKGNTPLHTAIPHNNDRFAKMLIAANGGVNTSNAEGCTPLHFAVLMGNESLAALLCTAGADVNAVDESGKAPLHYCKRVEVAELLIAKGARRDLKDKEGKTPFDHLDGRNGQMEKLLALPGSKFRRAEVMDLDEKIAANATSAQLFKDRGDAYFRLDEVDEAIEDYRRAIALDGTFVKAHFNLGQSLARLGTYEEALQSFDRALVLDANDADVLLSRALVFHELGHFERAIAECKALLGGKLSPENKEAANNVLVSAEAKHKLAQMTPVQITEAWYGVKLPAKYRSFLEKKVYEKYPAHRPSKLPSYGNNAPRVSFIYGRSVFGIDGGEGRFDPQDAEELANTFQLVSDVGVPHRVGDYIKKEVFSGLEFDHYDPGYLDKLIPLALLAEGEESQALAIDVTKPGCPVLMYDHETGDFEPVTATLADFLAGLKPIEDDEEDEDD